MFGNVEQRIHQDLYCDYNGGFNRKLEDWNTFTQWLVNFEMPQPTIEWWDNYRISRAIQIGLDLVFIPWIEEASSSWENVTALRDIGDDTQVPPCYAFPVTLPFRHDGLVH